MIWYGQLIWLTHKVWCSQTHWLAGPGRSQAPPPAQTSCYYHEPWLTQGIWYFLWDWFTRSSCYYRGRWLTHGVWYYSSPWLAGPGRSRTPPDHYLGGSILCACPSTAIGYGATRGLSGNCCFHQTSCRCARNSFTAYRHALAWICAGGSIPWEYAL